MSRISAQIKKVVVIMFALERLIKDTVFFFIFECFGMKNVQSLPSSVKVLYRRTAAAVSE